MPVKERRVVVTGLGLVSPVGVGAETGWRAVIAGRSGIGPVTRFDASALPTRIAGEVRDFRPEDWLAPREVRRTDRFIHFAVAAADMALRDSGLDLSREDPAQVGVVIGSGLGGLATLEDAAHAVRSHRKVSPFFVTGMIPNLAAGQISIRHGLQGPNFAPAAACATGNVALGEAMLLIERCMADVIIAGGAEATITPVGMAGFVASRAMSVRNDAPARASRPFDLARDGFVAAEGAGVLVLEAFEHARRRGARIYAELAGYGASADAYHVTAPAPSGDGARRAMSMALRTASAPAESIGYINAHATSTPLGDAVECDAIRAVFGSRATELPISSTKSMTGHMLGAAGGAEAVFTVLALAEGVLPPTLNVDDLDPACGLDVIPNVAREVRIDAAISNGFGFGGTNAAVLFRRL
jgi:3-oxoacyl-[acyl-carrier-protein] synthase II